MTDLKLTFKKYTKKDYDYIYDVKKAAYQKYVEVYYGWDEDVQQKMYKDFLKERGKNIKIILVNGEYAGFMDGCDLENGDYEQGNIIIVPKFQGRGLGTKILTDVLEKHKHQNVHLRVFKNNPAKNLYERLGFVTTGETRSHYLMVNRAKTNNKTL